MRVLQPITVCIIITRDDPTKNLTIHANGSLKPPNPNPVAPDSLYPMAHESPNHDP